MSNETPHHNQAARLAIGVVGGVMAVDGSVSAVRHVIGMHSGNFGSKLVSAGAAAAVGYVGVHVYNHAVHNMSNAKRNKNNSHGIRPKSKSRVAKH